MVEEAGKRDERKLEFDSAGEVIAYISLDQARVLALQHARDNRDFYGRYSDRDLVWDVIGADETEDYTKSDCHTVPPATPGPPASNSSPSTRQGASSLDKS